MRQILSTSGLILSIFLVACGADGGTVTNVPQASTTIQAQEAESNTNQEGYPAPSYPDPSTSIVAANDRPETLPIFPGSLAFSSTRLGSSSIFILTGSTGILTKAPTINIAYEPSWSPDCQQIAMTGEVGVNQFQVFKGSAIESGDTAKQIATSSPGDFGPVWSPDGRTIALQRHEHLQVNICFIEADSGIEQGCLDNSGFTNAMPAWSPDGSQIVFSSNRSGNYELHLTDYPNYESSIQLTNSSDKNFDPDFSPDGAMIAFAARRSGVYSIYTITPDGKNETEVISTGNDAKAPAWVSNNQIAFVNDIAGNEELFLASLGNTQPQQLTFSQAQDIDPVWCAE